MCIDNNNKAVPAISVIVPVYNTKQYLERCLSSIQKQSLASIEVIIIDDGSSDGSSAICDKYVGIDPRFKVIHKENEGLAAARNDGISVARGQYVMFVDSDDWVEQEFCEKPFLIAKETGSNLVVFGYTEFSETHKERHVQPLIQGNITKEDALIRYWNQTRAYAWNKLYKRELFNGIVYPVGRLYEDDAVTHRIVHRANKIWFLNESLYHYRLLRKGSITSSRTRKMMEDYFYCNFRRIDDLKEWGFEYNGEEAKLAVSYLATFGMKSELSTRCQKALRNCGTIAKNASWRRNAMFKIYRVSPSIFNLIAIATRKRMVQCKKWG